MCKRSKLLAEDGGFGPYSQTCYLHPLGGVKHRGDRESSPVCGVGLQPELGLQTAFIVTTVGSAVPPS